MFVLGRGDAQYKRLAETATLANNSGRMIHMDTVYLDSLARSGAPLPMKSLQDIRERLLRESDVLEHCITELSAIIEDAKPVDTE